MQDFIAFTILAMKMIGMILLIMFSTILALVIPMIIFIQFVKWTAISVLIATGLLIAYFPILYGISKVFKYLDIN